MKSDAAKGIGLGAPATVYVGLLIIVPVILLLAHSFWTQNYIDIDHTVTFVNYKLAFTDPLFRSLIFRSVWIAGSVTIATVVLAYPIAYFIAFKTERKTLWLLLVTVPFWSNYLLRIFAWKLVLGYNGVLNSGLMSIGLIDEPLGFLLYNAGTVVLTLAHAWAPFAILPIYVSLQKIDPSLIEAARDLGCNGFQRFWRVIFPLSISGIIAASLIIFIPTVGDYVTPSLVGGSSGKMIANIIQVMFGKANNWPMGAALSIISMLTLATVALGFVFTLKLIGRKIK